MDKIHFFSALHLRYRRNLRMIGVFVFFLVLAASGAILSASETVNHSPQSSLLFSEGQFLYSPMWTTTTYLRESDGSINSTWQSSYFPGVAVWWLGEGTILRTIRVGSGSFPAAGAGGGVQKALQDGTIVWDFRYNTDGHMSHHDMKALPNGNVLLIAWEIKSRTDVINAGRNPSYVSFSGLCPDHIVEVQPTGPTSGTIVWEWHVWDHLIQDYDPIKANYGVVGDHPELVDVNYVPSTNIDWMHTNSVDYNEEFDQILISVHNFNEIWVIDHSTTTAEAAGHTGGNSGKGGDLLYRWGNPAAYRRGTLSDKKLFFQHDTTWIKSGCPGEGNILVFNNGGSRQYSTVDEITPPVNENGEYYLAVGSAYGPTALSWTYSPQPSFFASHLSGAQRLSDGNTLICNGETGKVFEVTSQGTTVWQYNTGGQVFKVVYIPFEEQQPPEPNTPDLDASGSLTWTKVEPGATVMGSFEVRNIGDNGSLLNWTVNTSSITWGTWSFNPESWNHLTPDEGSMTVQVYVVAPEQGDTLFEAFLRVENKNNTNDFALIPVSLTTPVHSSPWWTMVYQFLVRFFQQQPFLKTLLNIFF
ncbi:MAG: hypothetical protein BV458_06080 [Thermoplasmata archaeon M9B2D]|nr:MAG: hypothetical protein BV458_06080 [Thermoplasmata archaeon M9B2D]